MLRGEASEVGYHEEDDKNNRLLHCYNCGTYHSSDETKWVKYDIKGVKSKGQMLRDQRDLLLLTGKDHHQNDPETKTF